MYAPASAVEDAVGDGDIGDASGVGLTDAGGDEVHATRASSTIRMTPYFLPVDGGGVMRFTGLMVLRPVLRVDTRR
jgi:hypothetical protein